MKGSSIVILITVLLLLLLLLLQLSCSLPQYPPPTAWTVEAVTTVLATEEAENGTVQLAVQ